MSVSQPSQPESTERAGPSRSGRTVAREVVEACALVGVAAAAALFAFAFRETSLGMLRVFGQGPDPTRAAGGAPLAVVAGVVGVLLVAAALLGRQAARRHRHLGITAVAASARGEAHEPSMIATLVRSSGTWLASAGMVPVGRESAILETGGAFGSLAGRRVGHRAVLAPAGIAAAFAAAYHAPIAGVIYVEEHLGIRRDRRAVAYSVVAAALSHAISVSLLHGHAIFPHRRGTLADVALLGMLAVVPAFVGARLFLALRDRFSPAAHAVSAVPARRSVVTALLVAAIVSTVPLTAGNGMEALRAAADRSTLTVALTLAVAKVVATSAALRAGVPGGAFSPTLAVSAGWALSTFLVADAVGVPLPGTMWDGMLVAMAIGVAVGLQAPLTALVVIPEMTGDLGLLPVCVVAVLAAWVLDRRVTVGLGRRRGARALHDEDA